MKNGQSDRLEQAVLVEQVAYDYGTTRVLRQLDVAVRPGEVLALLGPSGCGKTTLLRLIAGLLAPSEGRIAIAGVAVADAASRLFVPPERRGLGMVFQDYALWPHLTVGQNIAFPLEMRGVDRASRERRAAAALDRVGLTGYGDRQPGALSGGQQQRVAIARAVVAEPELVLFDEPLSNLDRELRDQLAGEIGWLLRSLGLTAVYVTHDQAEAFALADRVAVMRAGRIVQLDAPEALVDRPGDAEVADFLQLGTIARGEARDGGLWLTEAGMTLPMAAAAGLAGPGKVLLAKKAFAVSANGSAALSGTVRRSVFRGDHHALTIRIGTSGAPVDVVVSAPHRAELGETVGLSVDPARLRFFPDATTSNPH